MKLRDLNDGDLAALEREAISFEDSHLYDYFQSQIQTHITSILTALKSKSTPLDELRYNQGCLAQATCDILIVEGLLKGISREIANRRKETP